MGKEMLYGVAGGLMLFGTLRFAKMEVQEKLLNLAAIMYPGLTIAVDSGPIPMLVYCILEIIIYIPIFLFATKCLEKKYRILLGLLVISYYMMINYKVFRKVLSLKVEVNLPDIIGAIQSWGFTLFMVMCVSYSYIALRAFAKAIIAEADDSSADATEEDSDY